jgi:hypothetical protein
MALKLKTKHQQKMSILLRKCRKVNTSAFNLFRNENSLQLGRNKQEQLTKKMVT